jgi:ATP-dependent DNA ligase
MRSRGRKAVLGPSYGRLTFSCWTEKTWWFYRLKKRRGRLEGVLRDAPVTGIAFSDHANGDGEKVFEAASRMGLEGIIAKRTGSPTSLAGAGPG